MKRKEILEELRHQFDYFGDRIKKNQSKIVEYEGLIKEEQETIDRFEIFRAALDRQYQYVENQKDK